MLVLVVIIMWRRAASDRPQMCFWDSVLVCDFVETFAFFACGVDSALFFPLKHHPSSSATYEIVGKESFCGSSSAVVLLLIFHLHLGLCGKVSVS